MNAVFYISAAVALVAAVLVISRTNIVHSLLYMAITLSALAVILFVLGAPFVAALEIIIYAGAILVLFVFVIMMLNLGPPAVGQERAWLRPSTWIGPSVLGAVLLGELVYLLQLPSAGQTGGPAIEPRELGIVLFGPYVIGVELASMLLLAGLVGAYHVGRREAARRTNAVSAGRRAKSHEHAPPLAQPAGKEIG